MNHQYWHVLDWSVPQPSSGWAQRSVELARELVDALEGGPRHVHAVAELDHGAHQRLDLERAPGVDVLEHRRPVVADPRRALQPPVDPDGRLDAERPAHR